MRAAVSIFLVALLSLGSLALPISRHLCMGQVQAVTLGQGTMGCGGEEHDTPMPCCEDESELLLVDAEQEGPGKEEIVINSAVSVAPVDYPPAEPVTALLRGTRLPARAPDPPPRWSSPTIAFQVFRL